MSGKNAEIFVLLFVLRAMKLKEKIIGKLHIPWLMQRFHIFPSGRKFSVNQDFDCWSSLEDQLHLSTIMMLLETDAFYYSRFKWHEEGIALLVQYHQKKGKMFPFLIASIIQYIFFFHSDKRYELQLRQRFCTLLAQSLLLKNDKA